MLDDGHIRGILEGGEGQQFERGGPEEALASGTNFAEVSPAATVKFQPFRFLEIPLVDGLDIVWLQIANMPPYEGENGMFASHSYLSTKRFQPRHLGVNDLP